MQALYRIKKRNGLSSMHQCQGAGTMMKKEIAAVMMIIAMVWIMGTVMDTLTLIQCLISIRVTKNNATRSNQWKVYLKQAKWTTCKVCVKVLSKTAIMNASLASKIVMNVPLNFPLVAVDKCKTMNHKKISLKSKFWHQMIRKKYLWTKNNKY